MKGAQTLARGVGTGGIPDRRDAAPGEEGPSAWCVLYPRPIKKKKTRARARRPRRDSSLAPRASTRRAVSSGSCARRHRSVASAFCGPQSERLRSYWFVAGRGLTTRAPVRRGLETAPKRDSRFFFDFFFVRAETSSVRPRRSGLDASSCEDDNTRGCL